MFLRATWPSRPAYDNPFNPFVDFDRLRQHMLSVLDTTMDSEVRPSADVSPAVNLSEDKDNLYIRAELPGMKLADLSISALPKSISIAGKRAFADEPGNVSYHRKERAEGVFSRALSLPTEIAPDKVEARYSDGVLSLTLPKSEAAKPRQIAVKS